MEENNDSNVIEENNDIDFEIIEFQNNKLPAINNTFLNNLQNSIKRNLLKLQEKINNLSQKEVITEDLTSQVILNSKINVSTSSIKLLKYGNVCNLKFIILRDGNWDSTDNILTIPSSLQPPKPYSHFSIVAGANSLRTGSISDEGHLKIHTTDNTNWISGSVTWII